jgi:hypothetical protein
VLTALLICVFSVALTYAAYFVRAVVLRHSGLSIEAILLGAITNFFDTLGIGSMAPTMAWFKFRSLVADRLIPSTMLVGHTLPVMVQAAVFLVLLGVFVDPVLLLGSIVALVAGALLGAPLAIRARIWVVQAIVGIALVTAALLFALANVDLMPAGGIASSLPLSLTIIAIVANLIFGVLLNFGVGNYAPTLAMLSLMGMDPRLCFPIMAGGGALAAAGASLRHIEFGKVDLRIAAGITLGGIPAVLAGAFLVKSMPIILLRWLIVVVVIYAALVMLRAAIASRGNPLIHQL